MKYYEILETVQKDVTVDIYTENFTYALKKKRGGRQKLNKQNLNRPQYFFLTYLLHNKIKPQHKLEGNTRNKKTMHVMVWKNIITCPYYTNSIT